MATLRVLHEGITQDHRTGKWHIEGHPALRNLLFADRKHAEGFLVRVRHAETALEGAMRQAIEYVAEAK